MGSDILFLLVHYKAPSGAKAPQKGASPPRKTAVNHIDRTRSMKPAP